MSITVPLAKDVNSRQLRDEIAEVLAVNDFQILGKDGLLTVYVNDRPGLEQTIAAVIEAHTPNPRYRVLPNWQLFSDEIPIALLLKISALPLGAPLTSRITRLADGAVQWEGSNDRLLQLWNAQPPTLTAGEQAALNQLAEQHSIPLQVTTANQLTVA